MIETKTTHTPGPWKVGMPGDRVLDADGHESRAEDVCILTEDDREVFGVSEWSRVSEEDAQLMAAAPELLAACKAALGAFERNDAIDWNDLTRAIAKAEGASDPEAQ